MKVLFYNQDASFVPKAIDLAARELTSLATPGQGIPTSLFRLLFVGHLLAYFGCCLWLACLKLHFIIAVDQSQLDRAKASAKSAILTNLESQVYWNVLHISLLLME